METKPAWTPEAMKAATPKALKAAKELVYSVRGWGQYSAAFMVRKTEQWAEIISRETGDLELRQQNAEMAKLLRRAIANDDLGLGQSQTILAMRELLAEIGEKP